MELLARLIAFGPCLLLPRVDISSIQVHWGNEIGFSHLEPVRVITRGDQPWFRDRVWRWTSSRCCKMDQQVATYFLEHGTKRFNFLSKLFSFQCLRQQKKTWVGVLNPFVFVFKPCIRLIQYIAYVFLWKKTQWFEKVLMNYISWMILASRAMTKSHILRPEVVISWRNLEIWGWNWNMYVNIFEVYICVDTCLLHFKHV